MLGLRAMIIYSWSLALKARHAEPRIDPKPFPLSWP
jgi:hypothetical protein